MLIFGDLNMEVSELAMQLLFQQYSLFSMIRSSTCFKSPQGKCIDLMLTNSKHSFFGSQTFETGFSDFHHMIYTILKTTYTKLLPKIIHYRGYSKFSETDFLMDLSNALCSMIPENYDEFEGQEEKLLGKHAPCKKRTIRGNNKPHVSKETGKKSCVELGLKISPIKRVMRKIFVGIRGKGIKLLNLTKLQRRDIFEVEIPQLS